MKKPIRLHLTLRNQTQLLMNLNTAEMFQVL